MNVEADQIALRGQRRIKQKTVIVVGEPRLGLITRARI
jgi:hypothetical protein